MPVAIALFLAAFIMFASGTNHVSADELQDGTFRAQVEVEARKLKPDLPIAHPTDPAFLRVGSVELYLDNIYREVHGLQGSERQHAIADILANLFRANDERKKQSSTLTFEQAKPRLRLQIAPSDYVDNIAVKLKKKLVHRPLSPYIIVAYAIDAPDSLSYVTEDQLEMWKIDVDTLHALARANLDAAAADTLIAPKTSSSGPGNYVTVSSPDGYAAAHALSPAFMARLHAALGSNIVVAVPNRDFLVAWSRDFTNRAEFARLVARDYGQRPHPLSPELFVATEAGLRSATAAENADHDRPD